LLIVLHIRNNYDSTQARTSQLFSYQARQISIPVLIAILTWCCTFYYLKRYKWQLLRLSYYA